MSFDSEVPTMPSEFMGAFTKAGGYTTTTPRKWTKQEIEWLFYLNRHFAATHTLCYLRNTIVVFF